MSSMKRLFLYFKYYFQPKDKTVRNMAYEAAKAHFSKMPLRSPQRPYPRLVDYDVRRQEFLRFQRTYNDSYRHTYAVSKLSENHSR